MTQLQPSPPPYRRAHSEHSAQRGYSTGTQCGQATEHTTLSTLPDICASCENGSANIMVPCPRQYASRCLDQATTHCGTMASTPAPKWWSYIRRVAPGSGEAAVHQQERRLQVQQEAVQYSTAPGEDAKHGGGSWCGTGPGQSGTTAAKWQPPASNAALSMRWMAPTGKRSAR